MQLLRVSNFGGIDADSDRLLDECFEDHEAYSAATTRGRYLVLGRKGAGKTAIFRKIIKGRLYNALSFGHTFSDYPWSYHDKQKQIGVDSDSSYKNSWEYLILITVSKIILNQDVSQPWNRDALDHLNAIERFVVDSYGSKDPEVSQIFSPARTLRFQGKIGVNVGIGSAELGIENIPMSGLPSFFQEVNTRLLESIIETLNPNLTYFICFDELDIGFSKVDPNYKLRLIGLLLAAKRINTMSRNRGKQLSVIVFLRDDIYADLNFEDKNKVTETAAVRIEWDTGRSSRTLKDLMEKRFQRALTSDIPVQWEDVFDEQKQMTSRQTKYNHIKDRTFLRPRDIIKFCNEILQRFKRNPSESGKFENKHIIDARVNFSEYLLNELIDEIHKHVPEHEAYVSLLKDMAALEFDVEEIQNTMAGRGDELGRSGEPRSILKNLYEFSIIGYLQPGGTGGGAQYIFKHKEPTARFNERATRFRIHPGLKEVLGVKKYGQSIDGADIFWPFGGGAPR